MWPAVFGEGEEQPPSSTTANEEEDKDVIGGGGFATVTSKKMTGDANATAVDAFCHLPSHSVGLV